MRVVVVVNFFKNVIFIEEQCLKLLIIIVGKFVFNEIFLELFFYMNELMKSNIEEKIFDCFFLEKGVDVKVVIEQQLINVLFKKGILGKIIVEIFK